MLKLDYDGAVPWKRIVNVVEIFRLDVMFADCKWAKTKHGYHVYLSVLQSLNGQETCFLQCAMGSDYKRESLNWLRVITGNEWQKQNFNVLFLRKYKVGVDGDAVLTSQEKEIDSRIIVRKFSKHIRESIRHGKNRVKALQQIILNNHRRLL